MPVPLAGLAVAESGGETNDPKQVDRTLQVLSNWKWFGGE